MKKISEWKSGFKVVRKDKINGKYYSAVADCYVEFKVGKPAVPASLCGPICVFNNKADASWFIMSSSFLRDSGRIAKCEYIKHTGKQAVWDGQTREKPEFISKRNLARGTILASKVRLTEEPKKDYEFSRF